MMRVGVSGAIATAIDVGSLIALVELAHCHVTLAAFLSAAMGGVTNFLVNKYWAFADRSPVRAAQVGSYALVSLVTAMFCAASVHLFAVVLGLPYLAAKAAASLLVFVLWSYPAQARIVFPAARMVGSEALAAAEAFVAPAAEPHPETSLAD